MSSPLKYSLSLFALIFLAGCSMESKVVGTWEPKPLQDSQGILTISGDKTFDYKAGPMRMSGEWSIEDGKLDMTLGQSDTSIFTGSIDNGDLILTASNGKAYEFTKGE